MRKMISVILLGILLGACDKNTESTKTKNLEAVSRSQASDVEKKSKKLSMPLNDFTLWNEKLDQFKKDQSIEILTEVLEVQKNSVLDGEASQNYAVEVYKFFKVNPVKFLIEYKKLELPLEELSRYFAGESTDVDRTELKNLLKKVKSNKLSKVEIEVVKNFEMAVKAKVEEQGMKYE